MKITTTYVRLTIAGAVLVFFWASFFVGIRLKSGKWPGEGAPEHLNPVSIAPVEADSEPAPIAVTQPL